MDQRRIRCQGAIKIKNTGQRFKLQLYCANATLQRLFGFCQHQGQRVTAVAHLLIAQHWHILVDDPLAVAGGQVGSGQHRHHTGQCCCSRGVYGDDPPGRQA